MPSKGVGKGAAARHDIAHAATARMTEFTGGGNWSARTHAWARSERCARHTCMLKRQGGQQRSLRPASEWRARGGDWQSLQGPCLGMVVHRHVAVRSCSGVHAADGAGGIRRDEEELGRACGS
jgi:hypothetical protein